MRRPLVVGALAAQTSGQPGIEGRQQSLNPGNCAAGRRSKAIRQAIINPPAAHFDDVFPRLGDQPLHLHPDRGGRDMPPNTAIRTSGSSGRADRQHRAPAVSKLGDRSQVVAGSFLSVTLFDGAQER